MKGYRVILGFFFASLISFKELFAFRYRELSLFRCFRLSFNFLIYLKLLFCSENIRFDYRGVPTFVFAYLLDNDKLTQMPHTTLLFRF